MGIFLNNCLVVHKNNDFRVYKDLFQILVLVICSAMPGRFQMWSRPHTFRKNLGCHKHHQQYSYTQRIATSPMGIYNKLVRFLFSYFEPDYSIHSPIGMPKRLTGGCSLEPLPSLQKMPNTYEHYHQNPQIGLNHFQYVPHKQSRM